MGGTIQRYMMCLLLFIVVAGSVLPSFAAEKLERVAKLSHIVGDVQVKKAGGAKPFKAFNNMALTRGDQITTGKNSSAQLDLDDGSKLVVGSNTQSMISDLVKNAQGGNQTAVKVVSGQVWSKLQSLSNSNDSFKYETPTAVMGIRGTMLLVTGNSLFVTEGVVSLLGKGSQAETALVKSNEWGEASGTGRLDGGLINTKTLVDAMDSQVLHIATEDIIHAVYEAYSNPELVKPGKGMSNEFLQHAAEFVAAAKEKDPTIQVPSDFSQVVQEVAKQIADNLNSPMNPNPVDTISAGKKKSSDDQQSPTLPDQNPTLPGSPGSNGGSSTPPTSGNSGGGGGSGGSGGSGGGGGGGGSSQSIIDTVTAAPIGDGSYSRVTVKGTNTTFKTKPLIVNIDEKQWGDVPFSVGTVNTISDTELNFEVSTPDDGRYKLEFLYEGKPYSYQVSFLNGPSRIESMNVTTDASFKRIGTIRGRNLSLSSSGLALSMEGGNDNVKQSIQVKEKQSIPLVNFQVVSNNTINFTIPESTTEGTYAITLKINGKTYTFPSFTVPLRVVKVDAVLVETTDAGRSITVNGKDAHFKQNETTISVLNQAGQVVYQLAGSQLTVISETELRFQLPPSVVGDVTFKIVSKHEEGRGTLGLPKVAELELGAQSEPLYVGQTVPFKASAKLTDKTVTDVTEKAVWTATPNDLAAISKTGEFTAKKAGNVTVTAAFEGKTAAHTYAIQSNIKELKITPSQANVSAGKTFSFRAMATLLDGKTQDVTDLAAWTIADSSIATISGHTVTGVKLGTTTVTATIDKYQATAQVTVKPAVTALAITPPQASINVGQTTSFKLTATYADNKTEDVTSQVEWSTSDAGVAQVTSGIVTGVKAGNATVTASYQEQTAQAGVTVSDVVVPQPPAGPVVEVSGAGETSRHELFLSGRAVGADYVLVTLVSPNHVPSSPHTVSVSTDGSFTFTSGQLSEGVWKYKVEAVKAGVSNPATAKTGTVTITVSPSDVLPELKVIAGQESIVSEIAGNVVKVAAGKTVGDLRSALEVAGNGTFVITGSGGSLPANGTLVTNGMMIATKYSNGRSGFLYTISVVGTTDTEPPVPLSVNLIQNSNDTTTIEILFNEALDFQSVPSIDDFTVKSTCGFDCGGQYFETEAVASVTVEGNAVHLLVESPQYISRDGSSAKVSYSGTAIKDQAGNAAETFSDLLTNQQPVVGTIVLEGLPAVGQQVSSSYYTVHDPDGDSLADPQVEWRIGDSSHFESATPIAGADTGSYTIQPEDVGKYLFFVVKPLALSGTKIGEPAGRPVGPIVANVSELAPKMSTFTIEPATNEGIKISDISFDDPGATIMYSIYPNLDEPLPGLPGLPPIRGEREFAPLAAKVNEPLESSYRYDEWTVPRDDIMISAYSEITAVAIKNGNVVAFERKTITPDMLTGMADEEAVELDKNALEIVFDGQDNENSVTTDVMLPKYGEHGSMIAWTSSDDSVITITADVPFGMVGEVTRPDTDTTVTLTATISRNGVQATREFSLKVKGTSESPSQTEPKMVKTNVSYDLQNQIITIPYDQPLIDATEGHLAERVSLSTEGISTSSIAERNGGGSVSVDGNNLVITLGNPLIGNQNYVVVPSMAVKGELGSMYNVMEQTDKIAGLITVEAPINVSFIAPDDSITITFSKPIKAEYKAVVETALSNGMTDSQFTFVWSADNQKLTFTQDGAANGSAIVTGIINAVMIAGEDDPVTRNVLLVFPTIN
ncbi:immunoglobulin-like domain-containing protein [Brevibacillus fluminis]|uniref:immunoglobulin-like domain-containing protein n=1 Tax=Brevibacillus fluminis TaxID=511487 RepID=UPI003F8CE239